MANNNVNTAAAIRSLRPDSQWAVEQDLSGNEVITWISGGVQPTDEEITAERTRLQAEYDAQEYARKRKAEYPSIEECVHAILDDDLAALQVKRQAVKDKYPKE